jgi:hypothetical protein
MRNKSTHTLHKMVIILQTQTLLMTTMANLEAGTLVTTTMATLEAGTLVMTTTATLEAGVQEQKKIHRIQLCSLSLFRQESWMHITISIKTVIMQTLKLQAMLSQCHSTSTTRMSMRGNKKVAEGQKIQSQKDCMIWQRDKVRILMEMLAPRTTLMMQLQIISKSAMLVHHGCTITKITQTTLLLMVLLRLLLPWECLAVIN